MIGEAELPLKSQIIERLSPLDHLFFYSGHPRNLLYFTSHFHFPRKRKKKFSIKVLLSRVPGELSQVFLVTRICFYVLYYSLCCCCQPLVVLAPYEKVFFMLFSKKRGGVLSCNFFFHSHSVLLDG